MVKKCVDIGSDRCPCVLMESGQCYICNMIKGDKCDCGSLWQGVCPYNEYLQRGKSVVRESTPKKFKVYKTKSYSPTLTVLTLEVPIAYGVKCREMGAFLMLEWNGWFVPISVLHVKLDYKVQRAYIDLAVNASGPKTIGLLRMAMVGQEIMVKGPFYSGVLGREKFKSKEHSIILAKGIAVMPLINVKDLLKCGKVDFYLDSSKLPEEFLDKYLKDIEYVCVNLETDMFDISESLKEKYGYSFAKEGINPNLFFMMSPYYVENLLRLTSFEESRIIRPNHSNMCCGEGICGSCSYVDKQRETIKRCKCID